MKRTWVLAAAIALAGGCVYQGDDAPAGGFKFRSMLVVPQGVIDGENGVGFEAAGLVQHTAQFAMEYAAGYESFDVEPYPGSQQTNGTLRVSALYSAQPKPNLYVSLGGGVTAMLPSYTVGYDEALEAAFVYGIVGMEGDYDVGVGAHVQAEVAFVAQSGFSIGLFVRHTLLEVEREIYFTDISLIKQSITDDIELDETQVGLTIGLAF